jgi:hypothetical protein
MDSDYMKEAMAAHHRADPRLLSSLLACAFSFA